MGVGICYSAKAITPGKDGELPKQECENIARQALEIADRILNEANVPYEIEHHDGDRQEAPRVQSYGFTIVPKGDADDCAWLMFQWTRYPDSRDSSWHGDHYMKTQFAQHPEFTHIAMCRIIEQWVAQDLVDPDARDDPGWLEHHDSDRVEKELGEF